MNKLFADVSSNNGRGINLAQYADSGHRVLAVKASEGVGYADPFHRGWTHSAHLHHLIVVHYHFARPDLHSGAEEAAWFLHCTNGQRGPYDYLVYDGERAANGAFGLDVGHCREFDAYIRHHTRFHTVLYAPEGEATADALGDSPKKRYWNPAYGSGPDVHIHGMETIFRQFTDGVIGPEPHTMPGIGHCDVNVLRGSALRRAAQHG